MNSLKMSLLASVLVAGFAAQANAAAMYNTLTGWSTAVAVSGQTTIVAGSDFTNYSTINGLLFGSSLTNITPSVQRRTVGTSWSTWQGQPGSNGTSVYQTNGNTFTATFNPGTILTHTVDAFGFFAEPDHFSAFDITLNLNDGSTLTESVVGDHGAAFFGWVGNGINSITVSTADTDFAFGDFWEGFSPIKQVPEPFTLSLFGAGLVGAAALRRKKKNA
jgi:hypothetical protein